MSFPSQLAMSKGWKRFIQDGKLIITNTRIHWSSCGPPENDHLLLGHYNIDFLEPNRCVLRQGDMLVAYLYIKNNQIHGLAMFPANPTYPLPVEWRLGH